MNTGKTIFAQTMARLPLPAFLKCVQRYRGDYKIKTFSCLDQFLVMAFAQLSYRESLRDIEACLCAIRNKLYHMEIRGGISSNNLAHANETRDWRIWADFAKILIHTARHLYAEEPFGGELDQIVYAFDSITIDLCLSLFPWAKFRKHKAAIKLHTLLDLRGSIPSFVQITEGKIHCIRFHDAETDKRLCFLTNNFSLPALTIAQPVQMPLAGGTVFQTDQTAPENQGLLRHLGECGQDPGLDRCIGLCPGGHYQKAIGAGY